MGDHPAPNRYDDVMRPITRHYQENARRNATALLSPSSWPAERRNALMRDGWMLRGVEREFVAESALLDEIPGSDA